jgi:hypothetical protein
MRLFLSFSFSLNSLEVLAGKLAFPHNVVLFGERLVIEPPVEHVLRPCHKAFLQTKWEHRDKYCQNFLERSLKT